MPSPFIKDLENTRNIQVGFTRLERGGPMGDVSAEIVSAVVRTDQQPWRADFRSGALDTTEDWSIIQTGTGHTIDASSGNLVISTGTTINTETIIRSKRYFNLPLRSIVSMLLSQRIANQEFYIELTNAAGTIFGRWKFDGTSATAAKIETASGALAANQALNVNVTTLTTASPVIVETEIAIDEANFRNRTPDSVTAASERATRTTNLPHPDDDLYLQIRAKNLSVAPASNTNLTLHYLLVQDVNELAVEVMGGRGTTGGNQAINTVTTLQSTGNRVGSVTAQAIWQQINVAAQGANATSTGTGRDLHGSAVNSASASASYFKEYRTMAWADQPGTLHVEVSHDNVTYRRVRSVATTAVSAGNNVAEISMPPVVRYARSIFVNGGVANTAFLHADAYLSA